MNQVVKQVTVVPQTAPTQNQVMERVSLFNAAGEPLAAAEPAAAQADSVAATLGAMVVDFNALLAKLRAAGVMLT